jgi:hypothetical protein
LTKDYQFEARNSGEASRWDQSETNPNDRNSKMMVSQRVVAPVKTGVQWFRIYLELLDSGFRRNDDH